MTDIIATIGPASGDVATLAEMIRSGMSVARMNFSHGDYAFHARMAGLVLSESEHSHQALSDIIPLRDLFGLLFFVSVGMLLDPAYLRANLPVVFGLAALVSLLKAGAFAGLSRAFGYGNVIPLAMGLTMFQVGELSFVVARVGVVGGHLDQEQYSLLLSVALVTMFATPPISRLTTPIYRRLRARAPRDPLQTMNLEPDTLGNHVVIVGAGTAGLAVARMLGALDLHFVVVELDQRRLDACRLSGVATVYGDGAQGVATYIEKIGSELRDTMAMCGVHTLGEITRDCVRVL